MEIIKTNDFQKAFRKLPREIQQSYTVQEKRFRSDWHDSRLHTKKLVDLPDVFSLRVTRSYRVLFYFQTAQRAIFFEIDHRKDIYRDL